MAGSWRWLGARPVWWFPQRSSSVESDVQAGSSDFSGSSGSVCIFSSRTFRFHYLQNSQQYLVHLLSHSQWMASAAPQWQNSQEPIFFCNNNDNHCTPQGASTPINPVSDLSSCVLIHPTFELYCLMYEFFWPSDLMLHNLSAECRRIGHTKSKRGMIGWASWSFVDEPKVLGPLGWSFQTLITRTTFMYFSGWLSAGEGSAIAIGTSPNA